MVKKSGKRAESDGKAGNNELVGISGAVSK
jgi:hypothetical protein